jgi:5'(3')-deoxyribonucleotidase
VTITKNRLGGPSLKLPSFDIVSTNDYQRLSVGFDLDGVLYDFGASVKAYLASIGRPVEFHNNGAEPHTWNFFESWGMSGKEFVQICNDGADAGFIFCGGVRPNAVETVKAVQRLGHKIVIITDRSFGKTATVSEYNTYQWLKQHDIPYDEIYFTSNKTIVPTDIFVEDKLENYDAITATGTECWLINRDWNTEHGEDNRKRINDVIEFLPKVIDRSFVLVD